MTLLADAIHQQRWDLAALCLTLSCLQLAADLPHDAIVGLLEALEGEDRAHQQ